MHARVDELEAESAEPVSRRNMLRGVGAAVVGAAGGLALARPAAAADGDTLQAGETRISNSNTRLVADSYGNVDNVGMFHLTDDVSVTDASTTTSILSIVAANNEGFNTGISAKGTGIGARLDGPIPLQLADATASGAPDQATGTQGQFRVDNGDLWFCVANSGSNRWRKLTGNFSAGAFHAVTPFRAYDSRAANPVGNVGPISVGQNRLISVKDARDDAGVVIQLSAVPLDAKSVAANVTVTGTVGSFGYLTINPGGNTTAAASTINWSAAGQTIANGVTLTLNTTRELTVICGGLPGNTTQFIIDISGYFL
jgi:hypothetical protein